MLTLKNIWKEYQINKQETFIALRDINVTIKKGEFCSITGPSGSGKSTLMHVIGLLDRPSRGEILVDNENVLKLNDDRTSTFRSEFIGFVFQSFNLINKLSVLENVMLPTIYARHSLRFNPKDRAMYLLDRFGIGSKAKSYPNRISGGQQQRVAIARALIMEPKVILADEPTGNLDSKTGNAILDLISDLNKKEGNTVIIVTHEMKIAERAKRVIQVSDGKLIAS